MACFPHRLISHIVVRVRRCNLRSRFIGTNTRQEKRACRISGKGCRERSYLRRRPRRLRWPRWRRRRQRRVGQSNLATGDGRRYRPSILHSSRSLTWSSLSVLLFTIPRHSHFAFHAWRSAIMPSTVAVYSFPSPFSSRPRSSFVDVTLIKSFCCWLTPRSAFIYTTVSRKTCNRQFINMEMKTW